MRALAAIVFGACAALHPAPPASAPPPASATAVASAGTSPATSATADRPSGQPDPADDDASADGASDDDSDSPGSDFVEWDQAVALRGRTLAQAKQWLAAHGYHGKLAVQESHSDARCAFDTVCNWEPPEFKLDQPLTLTITKAKLEIAPPPGSGR